MQIAVGYLTEGGTGPSLTATLLRQATALISAVAITADVPVLATGNVPVHRGELLTLDIATANADNDFTGASVVVTMRIPYEDD